MISTKAERYESGVSPLTAKSADSVYFPDIIIDSLVESVRSSSSKLYDLQEKRPDSPALMAAPVIENPALSLAQSKALIFAALDDFDPQLGVQARKILNNPARVNIDMVEPGQARMMRCRAAGSEENDSHQAIIDYDYDGTIGGLIYLAHETGHAIADDYQIQAGYSHQDNPAHMTETQAYLVQNIVYDALKKSPNPAIADAAQRYFASEIMRNIYDIPIALVAMDALHAIEQEQPVDPAALFKTRFGDNAPQFIRNYAPAQNIHDTIAMVQVTDDPEQRAEGMAVLKDEYIRLHERPPSFLLATGITGRIQGADQNTKRHVSEMVLGKHGPKNISEVLARTGIERTDDLQAFSQELMQSASEALTLKDIAPGPALGIGSPSAYTNQ